MTKKTFNELYDSARADDDFKFMKTYRKLWPLFNSKYDRIKHRAKYWGCWLRFHRRVKQNNSVYYLFKIMNYVGKEYIAFEYLNQKDTK